MKKLLLSILTITAFCFGVNAQNYEWAKSMGGADSDLGKSIAIDGSGNVYTTGVFEGTVDFDPGAGTTNLTSAGAEDIFISKLDANGNFMWVKSMGGTDLDNGEAIAIDASGNVYVTGVFNGTVDFDAGSGTTNLTSNGFGDVFILKLDASGNLIWAKSFGGSNYDYGFSVAIDASGSVYTTGHFHETVDFDPSAASYNLVSNGGNDIFISKLDTNGNFVWAKNIGSINGNDYAYAITIDNSGNIYVTGHFSATVDFDFSAGTVNLTSYNLLDIFILKLNASGNFEWVKSMGDSGYDYGFAITTDTSGNVYTIGNYTATVDFDPSAATFNQTSNGGADIYISKLDANGDFVWAKSFGGSNSDYGQSITTDTSGNLYVSGTFDGTVDFDPGIGTHNLTSTGVSNICIFKLDANGNFAWAKSIGGASGDYGRAITTDVSGNIYATGGLEGIVDFDPGSGTSNLISNGSSDIFVLKLSQSSVGIELNEIEGSILNIYPNPTTTQLTINTKEQIESITIIDIAGKTIKKVLTTSKTIDVSDLINGMYFMQIQTDKGLVSKKFIKE